MAPQQKRFKQAGQKSIHLVKNTTLSIKMLILHDIFPSRRPKNTPPKACADCMGDRRLCGAT
jgi:hypothetical protein